MTATDATPATAASERRKVEWQPAQVRKILAETPSVKSLVLHVADWQGHLPGQHVDIRLTAEDGYQAQRSYSIASPPEEELVTLTVERVEDGEVSPYLVDELRLGDTFELRGPIGGYFVWTIATRGPLCLVAGGSGVVPLMAMLRHRCKRGYRGPVSLLYSSRSLDEVIYREEIEAMAKRAPELRVVNTLTRKQPPGWSGYSRRIDRSMLGSTCFPPQEKPAIFVCGPTSLVENVAKTLVELGHNPLTIKTERFGPSGG
ncbi:MAG TPA: ferredoxin reductase [Bradyrhizobium sp.]|nr:ferredoxin reductase [Bradyrhizobium sp.]